MILADRLLRFPSRKENQPMQPHTHIDYIHLSHIHLNIKLDSIERDLIYHTVYWLTLNGWSARYHQVLQIAGQFCGA